MGGEVLGALALPPVLQERRNVPGFDVAGIGSGRMQEGSAGPVDTPNDIAVERQQVSGHGVRVIGVQLQQPSPAAADTNDGVTGVENAVDNGLDGGVQTGDITAACQDSEAHGKSLRTEKRTWLPGHPGWRERRLLLQMEALDADHPLAQEMAE